jgi:hypothetical protein
VKGAPVEQQVIVLKTVGLDGWVHFANFLTNMARKKPSVAPRELTRSVRNTKLQIKMMVLHATTKL